MLIFLLVSLPHDSTLTMVFNAKPHTLKWISYQERRETKSIAEKDQEFLEPKSISARVRLKNQEKSHKEEDQIQVKKHYRVNGSRIGRGKRIEEPERGRKKVKDIESEGDFLRLTSTRQRLSETNSSYD